MLLKYVFDTITKLLYILNKNFIYLKVKILIQSNSFKYSSIEKST